MSIVLLVLLVLLCGAGWWSWRALDSHLPPAPTKPHYTIQRFDRVLDEYVSLGSYTALHRMNTEYPRQTKLLIEDVLELGRVEDPGVENKLRHYYLDSTVQVLLDEVHHQFSDLSDLEREFDEAFAKHSKTVPFFRQPHIYAQISCLRQSIIVSDTLIGISLDKYLGEDFPLYAEYFTEEQRSHMNRSAIVEDAVALYMKYQRELCIRHLQHGRNFPEYENPR